MTPLVAACLSSLGTIATLAQSDRLPKVRVEYEPVRECQIAIMLVAADATAVARAIDASTGGLGWSHCFIDPCRVGDDGKRMVIGYTVANGVHWATLEGYKSERKRARIELDARTGAEVWGCARARLGKPLRVSSLVLGVPSAATCVGLVVECLPFRMQQALRARMVGPCISPNTLADFFRVGAA